MCVCVCVCVLDGAYRDGALSTSSGKEFQLSMTEGEQMLMQIGTTSKLFELIESYICVRLLLFEYISIFNRMLLTL